MTTGPTVDEVLGPGGLLAGHLPGFQPRAVQLEMARAVADALAGDRPLCVEAGTGTGKTLAYLVPALLSGKKVVVSTGTRTLQEQIFEKDLPLARRALPDAPPAVAYLKGLTNYLCRRRFGDALRARIGAAVDPVFEAIARWEAETETGDRAELRTVPDDAPAWSEVVSSPETRIGPRCPQFERCFATRARREAARAQVVVVNHHLFFADLALRDRWPGAGVIPPYDAVIFDEAHQLEEIATAFFGVGVSAHRVALLADDALDLLRGRLRDARGEPLCRHVEATASELFRRLNAFLASRPARPHGDGDSDGDGGGGRVLAPEDLFAAGRREAWLALDTALEELHHHTARLASAADEAPGGAPTSQPANETAESLHGIARRAAALRDDLAVLADRGAHGYVYWAEARGPERVQLRASPIDVAPLLRERLHAAVPSAVFTSATLAPGGRFGYFRSRIGLDRSDAVELVLPSPFDFARRALLYVGRDLPEPRAEEFAEAAAERVRLLCEHSRGRALVLFTSYRNLRTVAGRLRGRLPYPLYAQGEAPRASLVERLRREPAILLATASFWEGVDVPGEALSLVVIDKLPFSVPDDPIHRARCERIAGAGGDPFSEYEVPRAALLLKQGFGRLIRTLEDRGVVAVLDRRLLTKGYGRAFLAALPPARRTTSLEDVARFFAASAPRSGACG